MGVEEDSKQWLEEIKENLRRSEEALRAAEEIYATWRGSGDFNQLDRRG